MGLQMPQRDKYAVVVLLCLGYMATIAGAVRTFYTWKAFIDPEGKRDLTWYEYNGFIASSLELQIQVVSITS
jgi:hypothetical protein